MAERTKRGVFINCPFDDAYRPVFDAVVFAVLACEHKVRSALELADSGDLRLDKIYRLISESTHSIHDLSRVEVDDATGLPRFNMPIELGIALGYKKLAARTPPQKLLILDSQKYRYQKFASDLAGLDIAEHGNRPVNAIARVRDFLSSDDPELPTADHIEALYRVFEAALPGMAGARKQNINRLTFSDRLRLVELFLTQMRVS